MMEKTCGERQGVSLIFSGKLSGLKEQDFALGKVKDVGHSSGILQEMWLEWLRLEPGYSRAYLLDSSRHQKKGQPHGQTMPPLSCECSCP